MDVLAALQAQISPFINQAVSFECISDKPPEDLEQWPIIRFICGAGYPVAYRYRRFSQQKCFVWRVENHVQA